MMTITFQSYLIKGLYYSPAKCIYIYFTFTFTLSMHSSGIAWRGSCLRCKILGGRNILSKKRKPRNNKCSLPHHWEAKVEIKLLCRNLSTAMRGIQYYGTYIQGTFLLAKTFWPNRSTHLFCSRSQVRGVMSALPWVLGTHAPPLMQSILTNFL